MNEDITPVGKAKETTQYHGTSLQHAKDIVSNGIMLSKCSPGYFGVAFYTTDDLQLAKTNYADFCGDMDEDEPGGIVAVKFSPNAKILDLRVETDWETYKKLESNICRGDCAIRMKNSGVDGLYDRSFGGVCIYNPRAVESIKLVEMQRSSALDDYVKAVDEENSMRNQKAGMPSPG